MTTEHSSLGGLARRTVKESTYLISAFPLVLASFTLVVTGITLGASLVILGGIGLLILVATLVAMRGLATLERVRLRKFTTFEVASPQYRTLRAHSDGKGGALNYLQHLRNAIHSLGDAQAWRDCLWGVASFITGTFAFCVAVTWWAAAAIGSTSVLWNPLLSNLDLEQNKTFLEYLGFDAGLGTTIAANTIVGLVALVTLPWIIRALTTLHGGLAVGLLSDQTPLLEKIRRMEVSQQAAQQAEATSLRRIERDLHDGPQQDLIRLSMDIARAREHAAANPDKAQEILDGALERAQSVGASLRNLSRSIAPPILIDRGLKAAIEERVSLSLVPVNVNYNLTDNERLGDAAETAVYYVVSESLTNIAKHAQATQAAVAISRDDLVATVVVRDDGQGGAHLAKGSGLIGLRDRVLGLGGEFELNSPEGGPTTLTARLPLVLQ